MDCAGYVCGICGERILIGDIYVIDLGVLYHASCAENALPANPVAR